MPHEHNWIDATTHDTRDRGLLEEYMCRCGAWRNVYADGTAVVTNPDEDSDAMERTERDKPAS